MVSKNETKFVSNLFVMRVVLLSSVYVYSGKKDVEEMIQNAELQNIINAIPLSKPFHL